MNMKPDLTEFNKAERMLKERGIKYEREDQESGYYERHMIKQTNENDEWVWDFVCSTGTYGSDDGLLEYWSKKLRDNGDEPFGWLTAEEVIQKIEEGV